MGLSDKQYEEFQYLDRRAGRMKDWMFATCPKNAAKRDPNAPCKLSQTDVNNWTDFYSRWINFAGDVNAWKANQGSVFGSTIDDNAVNGWRKEFDGWEKILHGAGWEADATAPAPKPDVPPPETHLSTDIHQLFFQGGIPWVSIGLGAAGVLVVVGVLGAMMARAAAPAFPRGETGR